MLIRVQCWGLSRLVQAGVGRDGREFGPATPALFFPRSLDSDQKDQLIEVIEKLLADKTTVSRAQRLPCP